MSMMSISQSAMVADSVHAARCFPMSSQSQSSRCASEPMDSKRAMCTMHMADKAAQAAMAMSMAAMSFAGIILGRTDVHTSVSLFAVDLFSIALLALVVLLSVSLVSLLLVSLVVLISLITLLLICLTGQKMLESLVGQAKSVTGLASIMIHSMQGD